MTVEGWCVPCRQDRPSTEDHRCADCGHVLIQPSWSSRHAPYPWPPRPEGWHWEQPTDDKPRTTAPTRQKPRTDFEPPPGAATIALTCAWCTRVTQVVPRGGSPQRYCSIPCKDKATTQATAERKRAARQVGAGLAGAAAS